MCSYLYLLVLVLKQTTVISPIYSRHYYETLCLVNMSRISFLLSVSMALTTRTASIVVPLNPQVCRYYGTQDNRASSSVSDLADIMEIIPPETFWMKRKAQNIVCYFIIRVYLNTLWPHGRHCYCKLVTLLSILVKQYSYFMFFCSVSPPFILIFSFRCAIGNVMLAV